MVKVVREPEAMSRQFGVLEHCSSCFKPTPYWYERKDVALCPDCAKTVKAAEIPSKKAWCAEVARRFPSLKA